MKNYLQCWTENDESKQELIKWMKNFHKNKPKLALIRGNLNGECAIEFQFGAVIP